MDTKKYLVYCCVFYNENYFKLLNLLLMSLKFYSMRDEGYGFDFLIITNPEFESKVKELSSKFDITLHVQCCKFTTIFQAACARLHIFEYEHIDLYDKILYLDTDIIIKGDLMAFFNYNLDDVLYALECGTIKSLNFGYQFFDFYTIKWSTTGINSGTLLFNNSPILKDLFSRMRNHIDIFTLSGEPIPYCMDQPFINYHAIKDNLYNNTLIKPIVALFEESDNPENIKTAIVCHFSYPIGNFSHKYDRMCRYLSNIINKSSELIPTYTNICYKSYSWGSGNIKFTPDLLETTWGKGKYDILDKNTVRAYWNNNYHVIRFNKEYDGFFAIRTLPLDFEYTDSKLILA
jgi:hypothetical protein